MTPPLSTRLCIQPPEPQDGAVVSYYRCVYCIAYPLRRLRLLSEGGGAWFDEYPLPPRSSHATQPARNGYRTGAMNQNSEQRETFTPARLSSSLDLLVQLGCAFGSVQLLVNGGGEWPTDYVGVTEAPPSALTHFPLAASHVQREPFTPLDPWFRISSPSFCPKVEPISAPPSGPPPIQPP